MHPNRCMSTSIWDMSTSIWDTGGTALYTVRGVGSGSRDVDAWTQTSLYVEDRGLPSTDDPGACQNKCFFRSYGLLDWSTLRLSFLFGHRSCLNCHFLIVCCISVEKSDRDGCRVSLIFDPYSVGVLFGTLPFSYQERSIVHFSN
jgi:hypothetical protein